MSKEDTQTLRCSFCGKDQREVKKLIAGPTVYICDECIGLCNDIIAEEIAKEPESIGEVRSVILARLENHDLSLTRLAEFIRRNADLVPSESLEALTELDLASVRLREALAGIIPPPAGQGSLRS